MPPKRQRRDPGPDRDDDDAPDGARPRTRNNAAAHRLDEQGAQLVEQRALIADQSTNIEQLMEAVGEIQQQLATLLDARPSATVTRDPLLAEGTHPLRELVRANYPWIDDQTILNIINGTLEPLHLVKLIPTELRAKGATLASGNRLSFDLDTLQPSLSMETSPSAFLKQYPSFATYTQAISIYAALRSLFDTENQGYGAAINLYISYLATQCILLPNQWPGILNYAVAFFRKNQNKSPMNWVEPDNALYNTYITVYTQTHPVPARNSSTPSSYNSTKRIVDTICVNFNTAGKGCHWERCFRKHICSNCKAPTHPVYECRTSTNKPVSSAPSRPSGGNSSAVIGK